jgi:hypothetical protein
MPELFPSFAGAVCEPVAARRRIAMASQDDFGRSTVARAQVQDYPSCVSF